MQQKLNKENIPEECNTSLINNEAITKWIESEKLIYVSKKKEIS